MCRRFVSKFPRQDTTAICLPLLAILLPLLLASCSGGAETSPPPNVFVIVVDTLRADRVSWYEPGTTQPPLTPFLRTLAEHGTVFWNAYAQSSWTVPSVATLFTSRYSSQHHTTQFDSILAEEEQTIAEAFEQRGYATAGFLANAQVGDPQRGWGQGFGSFGLLTSGNGRGAKGRAEQINAAALAWLDGLPSGAAAPPVFLYLHYMEPHIPYDPPSSILQQIVSRRGQASERLRAVARAQQKIEEMIATLNIPAPDLGGHQPPDYNQAWLKAIAILLRIDDETLAGIEDLYDAEVASVDTQLAELFGQLQRRGWLANALVVVTADHGEEFREHGLWGHGATLYNEVLHVPLLMVAPRQTERIDVRDTVSLIDIAPTLLDYSSIAPPSRFEGMSARGAILRARGWRRWLTTVRHLAGAVASPASSYSELFPFSEPQRHNAQLHRRSLIAGSHKLIVRADDSAEAYDLAADPGEHVNATPATAPIDLRQSLSRFAERMADSGVAPPVAPLDQKAKERLHALGYAQ